MLSPAARLGRRARRLACLLIGFFGLGIPVSALAYSGAAGSLAAPLPHPIFANQCEGCTGALVFVDRPTDMARMRQAFNTVLVRTYDPDAVAQARAAGLTAILEFDDKDAWKAGQDISGRVNWIVSFIKANPGAVAGIWVADQLNKGTLTPDQQIGYLAATGGVFHQQLPGVPVFVDVSDWQLTCDQPGQASCAALAATTYQYQTDANLSRLHDSGSVDGFFLADNLENNDAAANARAYSRARALWPAPFSIVARTSHLSFPEPAFAGGPAGAATLSGAYEDAPMGGGIDGIDLWAWHRPWVDGAGVNELRTFLNKDFTTNPLWDSMAASFAHWANAPAGGPPITTAPTTTTSTTSTTAGSTTTTTTAKLPTPTTSPPTTTKPAGPSPTSTTPTTGPAIETPAPKAPLGSANLVGNPDFEAGTSGWNANPGTTLDVVSPGHTGAAAARLVNSQPGDVLLNDSPNWVPSTTAGSTCTASAWVSGPPGATVKIRFREYAGQTLAGYDSVPSTLSGPGWQQISVTFPVVNGGDTLDLNIYGDDFPAGAALLIDDVSESCS
jgi:hypothetical protein